MGGVGSECNTVDFHQKDLRSKTRFGLIHYQQHLAPTLGQLLGRDRAALGLVALREGFATRREDGGGLKEREASAPPKRPLPSDRCALTQLCGLIAEALLHRPSIDCSTLTNHIQERSKDDTASKSISKKKGN